MKVEHKTQKDAKNRKQKGNFSDALNRQCLIESSRAAPVYTNCCVLQGIQRTDQTEWLFSSHCLTLLYKDR